MSVNIFARVFNNFQRYISNTCKIPRHSFIFQVHSRLESKFPKCGMKRRSRSFAVRILTRKSERVRGLKRRSPRFVALSLLLLYRTVSPSPVVFLPRSRYRVLAKKLLSPKLSTFADVTYRSKSWRTSDRSLGPDDRVVILYNKEYIFF